jgi:transcription initiation factor IIE alpha subunit
MGILKNLFVKKENGGNNPKYQCPMHCEGKKVYDKPGSCPVCKMKLVPVKNK